jgi:hypothetical protein
MVSVQEDEKIMIVERVAFQVLLTACSLPNPPNEIGSLCYHGVVGLAAHMEYKTKKQQTKGELHIG